MRERKSERKRERGREREGKQKRGRERERERGEVTQGHWAHHCDLLLQSMLQTSKSLSFGQCYVSPEYDRQIHTLQHSPLYIRT